MEINEIAQTQTPAEIPIQAKGTPVWLMLLIIMVFPPAAWYLMWKEKKYHSWFAWTILINAAIVVFVLLAQMVFVMPRMADLYREMGSEISQQTKTAPYLMLIIGLAEASFGIILMKQIRRQGELPKKLLYPTLAVVIFHFLIAAYMMAMNTVAVIYPLYSLTSQL